MFLGPPAVWPPRRGLFDNAAWPGGAGTQVWWSRPLLPRPERPSGGFAQRAETTKREAGSRRTALCFILIF